MLRLLTKVTLIAALLAVAYGAVWLLPVKSQVVYATVLDKHQRLHTTKAPRMIFAGGSGVALGLDSELIEQSLHVPVINMGVNAGFGLRYMLAEIEPELQAHDVVVIVPEYEHFYGSGVDGNQNLLWALRLDPAAIKRLPLEQLLHLLGELPAFMQTRIQEVLSPRVDSIYNRSAFNEHGDFVNHLQLASAPIIPYAIAGDGGFNEEALAALNQFDQHARAVGAHVLLLYPTVASTFVEYGANRAAIAYVHQRIKAATAIRVLAEPDDCVLPQEYFFDTVYHLNARGRSVRSEQALTNLKVAAGDVLPGLPAVANKSALDAD